MKKKTFFFKKDGGFHLRPATILSKTIRQFDCEATLTYNGEDYDATSPIDIVGACIKQNEEFTITCIGTEDWKCIKAITELAERDFQES